mmetsp:Transcript_3055/g.5152  ORF Transcript_3055/g.5152 Transcript_3055/m.5152 type:complete len:234 (+) Transcript_3055:3265-3966(+)
MDVVVGGDGVVGVPQIPDVDDGVLHVVVGDHELSRDLGVPHHLGLLLLHGLLTLTLLLAKVVVHAGGGARGLCEVVDGLAHLEVPDHDFTVFARAGKDVGDHTVPTDRGYPGALVVVGLAGFEDVGSLDVGGDVLNQHFLPSTGKQVLFVRVEFNGGDGHVLVDLRGRDAALAHLEVLNRGLAIQYLLGVPEGNGSVLHSSSNDAVVILEIDPVNRRKLGGGLGDPHLHQSVG